KSILPLELNIFKLLPPGGWTCGAKHAYVNLCLQGMKNSAYNSSLLHLSTWRWILHTHAVFACMHLVEPASVVPTRNYFEGRTKGSLLTIIRDSFHGRATTRLNIHLLLVAECEFRRRERCMHPFRSTMQHTTTLFLDVPYIYM
ncbi:unnamed protein product, partial [Ectocarpus sp. 13 AM-2016]